MIYISLVLWMVKAVFKTIRLINMPDVIIPKRIQRSNCCMSKAKLQNLKFVEKAKRETGQQRPSKFKSSYTYSFVNKTSLIPHQDGIPPVHEETTSHNNSAENTSQVTLS